MLRHTFLVFGVSRMTWFQFFQVCLAVVSGCPQIVLLCVCWGSHTEFFVFRGVPGHYNPVLQATELRGVF